MEKIVITFKNIKFMEGHEGDAYNADLYLNGKKRGKLMNDGNGGCYTYYRYDKGPAYEDEQLLEFIARKKLVLKDYSEKPFVDVLDMESLFYFFDKTKVIRKKVKTEPIAVVFKDDKILSISGNHSKEKIESIFSKAIDDEPILYMDSSNYEDVLFGFAYTNEEYQEYLNEKRLEREKREAEHKRLQEEQEKNAKKFKLILECDEKNVGIIANFGKIISKEEIKK